eukprot:459951-Prymnesium_polylepis.1
MRTYRGRVTKAAAVAPNPDLPRCEIDEFGYSGRIRDSERLAGGADPSAVLWWLRVRPSSS